MLTFGGGNRGVDVAQGSDGAVASHYLAVVLITSLGVQPPIVADGTTVLLGPVGNCVGRLLEKKVLKESCKIQIRLLDRI